MKYWRATEFGEPRAVLRLAERELPEPGEGVVEIRVEATGVGLPDVLMTRGNYPAVRKPPVTPGQEIAGTVVRTGPGCTLKPGDAVLSSTRFMDGLGGFAERCLVPEIQTLRRPRGMSVEEAAGFFVPFHTGYVGVVQRGELKAGETLLVLGGAGSSGSAAIQLGKALGARVIATVSSGDKAAFCRGLGADHVINYRETPIHEAVQQIVGRRGVEMIFDPVGGAAYDQAVKCIARHGRVILIGYSSGSWAKVDPLNAVLRSYSLVGAFPGARTLEETRAQHEALCALAEAGKIRTPIDRVYPFAEVPEAIERVGSNQAVGKVIVRGT
jgi:NADPH:quinone reductase-like Zn-dependent oxidoreductase